MKKTKKKEFAILENKKGIQLFYPHIAKNTKKYVNETLSGKWIGQGPKVDEFEKKFEKKFLGKHRAVSVGSGTDALHLAYLLANIKKNDEVLVPVFTCTATNIPLLYIGAKIVFIDIDISTMNISLEDLKKKISPRTKAIVCVDYGGFPNNYQELNKICKKNNIQLIADAAHSLGSKFGQKNIGQLADFTIFSFQAIKTLTTGDGGMLAIKDNKLVAKAKRLRWFGIDKDAKNKGIWENDINEIGYKYQMNDISAAMGIAGLEEIDEVISIRNKLFSTYEKYLTTKRIKIVGKSKTKKIFTCAWLMTIIVDKDRLKLMSKLRKNNIDSSQVHYRNDIYSVFGGGKQLENMDKIEDNYLVLPIHTKLKIIDIKKICNIINDGW